MRPIFSTANVPQDEAYDYWQDIACANIQRVKGRPFDREDFYGELKTGTLGDVTIADWRSASGVSRCDGTDDLILVLPSTRSYIEFADRGFEINRSSVYLLDCRKPFVVYSLEPPDRVQLRLPREALERRVSLTNGVNRPIPLRNDAAILTALARELVRIGPSTLSPQAAAIVHGHMIDLTAVILGNLAGIMPRLGATGRFSALRLRMFIESQLTNPDADAQSIAFGAGISERHANRLLALEGTSIRSRLIERRLDRCREMLENPQQMHCSITDIAFFYGFRNLSHFTRAFKDRFGLSPSEHRSAYHRAARRERARTDW